MDGVFEEYSEKNSNMKCFVKSFREDLEVVTNKYIIQIQSIKSIRIQLQQRSRADELLNKFNKFLYNFHVKYSVLHQAEVEVDGCLMPVER